jgi:lambda repressor-like predicted transcriptional regulator
LREEFKRDARKKFRENFLSLLRKKYYFWAVYLPGWQKSDYAKRLQDFVDRHFRALVGRVFQPAGTPHCLILALEQSVVNVSLKGALDKDYEKIRQIVKDEKCEIFQVWPHEIWDNGNSQKWDDESLQQNKVTELGVVDALVKFS